MTLRCWLGNGDMGMNVCGCIWQTEVEIQRWVSIHTRISKLHPLRAPGGKGATAAMSALRAQVSKRRNQGSLQNRLTVGTGWGKHTMKLEHLVERSTQGGWDMSKGVGTNVKKLLMVEAGTICTTK